MRTLMKAGLVAILSTAVLGIPALASPANPASVPLGVVLQAENAQTGVDIPNGGVTVYNGDRLQTPAGGTLRARLGGAQVFLRQSTITQVHAFPNGFSADLKAGTVIASSTEGQTFRLNADGATIRPSDTKGATAQVTRVNDKQLLVTSTRGPLTIAMGDEVRTIAPGSSYRMEVESDDPGPEPQQGPRHTARNRFGLWLIVGVSAATGIAVWRALVSPSNP